MKQTCAKFLIHSRAKTFAAVKLMFALASGRRFKRKAGYFSLLAAAAPLLLWLTCCTAAKEQAEPQAEQEVVLPVALEITDAHTTGGLSPKKDSRAWLTISARRPETLNPLLNADLTVDRMLKLCYEPLFLISQNFEPTANLAEGAEVSADAKSAVIRLKKDMFWEDGARVTSADLIFSINTLRADAPEDGVYKHCVKRITRAEALDDFSARIFFDSREICPEYLLVFPLIPEHVFRNDLNRNQITGCGAFYLESFERERVFVFVRKQNAAGAVENVRALISPDAQTDLNAFNAGVTDIAFSDCAELVNNRSPKNVNITPLNTTDFEFLAFNSNNALFGEKDVREAFAHAVNVNDIVSTAYLGGAVKTLSFVHPNSPFYNAQLEERPFDLAYAGEKLMENGFLKAEDAFYFGGARVELNLLTNAENLKRRAAARIIASDMARLGVKVNVTALDYGDYLAALENGAFDLALCGLNCPMSFDFSFAVLNGPAPLKHMFFENSEFKTYIDDVFFAPDLITYTRAAYNAQECASAQTVFIPLLYLNRALLTNGRVVPGESVFINNCLRFDDWTIFSDDY